MQCPHCRESNTRRSRTSILDVLYMFVGLLPFRCHTCFYRFHRPFFFSYLKSESPRKFSLPGEKQDSELHEQEVAKVTSKIGPS